MKLTKAEQQTLRLMTYLACEWETTLIQANTPDYGEPTGDLLRQIKKCQRNIERFRKLETRLRQS